MYICPFLELLAPFQFVAIYSSHIISVNLYIIRFLSISLCSFLCLSMRTIKNKKQISKLKKRFKTMMKEFIY